MTDTLLEITTNRVVFYVKNHRTDNEIYHKDRECPRITKADNEIKQTTEEQAQHRGRRQCQDAHCWGTTQREEYGAECPFCGEKVGKLPSHLPCDEVTDE